MSEETELVCIVSYVLYVASLVTHLLTNTLNNIDFVTILSVIYLFKINLLTIILHIS